MWNRLVSVYRLLRWRKITVIPRFRGADNAYITKVLGYNPDAFWPLLEKTGIVARCYVNPAQNGTYHNCTLADAPSPDGDNNAPLFNGLTSYVDLGTATFLAAFDGAEGSVSLWARVQNVGVWSDGFNRYAAYFQRDGNNQNLLYKSSLNNRFQWWREGAGVAEDQLTIVGTPITWVHIGMTWSEAADQVIYYWNGVQSGAIDVGLGAFVNPIVRAELGTSLAAPWFGWMAYLAVFGSALGAAAMADLAVT